MPISFPRFIKIRDFNLYEKNSQKTQFEELSSKYKNHNLAQTNDQQDSQTSTYFTNINQASLSELSFQKWFMNEHLQTYDIQVKLYLESIFQDDSNRSLNFLNEDYFNDKLKTAVGSSSIESYLRSSECLLGTQESQIFMEKLENCQKLKEFLESICFKSSDQIAHQLLFLCNYVLKEYQKIKNQELPYQMLLISIKNIVEQNWQTIKNINEIQILTLKKYPSIKIVQTRKFIEFLITTFFLVAFEYVNNPYYSQAVSTQLKRHIFFNNSNEFCDYDTFSSSEDESECDFFSHSRKKRK